MTLPATDNFNRANGGLGSNWTTQTGQSAPQIIGNMIETASVGSDSFARWNADTFNNDQYSQVKAVDVQTNTSRAVLACLRMASAANTFYRISAEGPLGASATLRISKCVAGTTTSITSATKTINANDVLKADIVGTTITAYINGVSQLSTTDSAISTGSAGLGVFVDTGSIDNADLDDWEGGNTSSSESHSGAATGRSGSRGIGLGVKATSSTGTARTGARGVEVGVKATAGTAVSSVGARALCAGVKSVASANTSQVGARGLAAGSANGTETHAGAAIGSAGVRSSCVGVKASAAAAASSTGARGVAALVKKGTATAAGRAGCQGIVAGRSTRSNAALGRAGLRALTGGVLPGAMGPGLVHGGSRKLSGATAGAVLANAVAAGPRSLAGVGGGPLQESP